MNDSLTDLAPFGYCPLPECGRPGVEMKPDGTVLCEKQHAYRPGEPNPEQENDR